MITIHLSHSEMRHYQDLFEGAGIFKYHPERPLDPGATPDQVREHREKAEAALRERAIVALESVLGQGDPRPRERLGTSAFVVRKRENESEPRWQEVA